MMFCMEQRTDSKMLSYEQMQTPAGEWDFARLIRLVVLSPLKEEALYRVLVFYTVKRRSDAIILCHNCSLLYYFLSNDRVDSMKVCIFIVSIIFGATHFMNAVNGQYSLLYISCQVSWTVVLFHRAAKQ